MSQRDGCAAKNKEEHVILNSRAKLENQKKSYRGMTQRLFLFLKSRIEINFKLV